MAYIHYIHMFVFLLTLITSLEIQVADGRKLKEIKEHQFNFVKTETGLHDHARKAINFEVSPQNLKDDLPITGEKQSSLPTHSHEFRSIEASHSDDFRPTTPGNSPGIGHSFAEQKDNTPPKMFVTGNTDDFRPTGPGHSPGIGHSLRDVNVGPNA